MLIYNHPMAQKLLIDNIKVSQLHRVATWQHAERERYGCAGSLAEREARLREHIDSDVANQFPVTYVATWLGEAIGCCSLVYYRCTAVAPKTNSILWLSNVYVDPKYRNRGVAARLISHSQKQAAAAGIKQIQLFTSGLADYYRARGWYESGDARVGKKDVKILTFDLGRF